MNIDTEVAKKRILDNQTMNVNKRFKNEQLTELDKRIKEFALAQNTMVEILKNKGISVHEADSDPKEIIKYIL